MDVDQEADRTDPDGPVQEEQVQEERRRGGQLRPVEEIVHLTEGLLYLDKELQLDQHLREQLMPLEVEHLQVEDKLQEQLDKLVLQELTHV